MIFITTALKHKKQIAGVRKSHRFNAFKWWRKSRSIDPLYSFNCINITWQPICSVFRGSILMLCEMQLLLMHFIDNFLIFDILSLLEDTPKQESWNLDKRLIFQGFQVYKMQLKFFGEKKKKSEYKMNEKEWGKWELDEICDCLQRQRVEKWCWKVQGKYNFWEGVCADRKQNRITCLLKTCGYWSRWMWTLGTHVLEWSEKSRRI